MTNLHVRPIRDQDWPGIQEVQSATYGEDAMSPEVYQWWSKGLSSGQRGGVVAVSGERIVGVQPMEYFQYIGGETPYTGGMLTGVAVHPVFRRQGIFTKMIDACEQDAWSTGAEFIVTLPNDRSKPGFVKRGYVDLGRRTLLLAPLIISGRSEKSTNGFFREVEELSPDWENLFLNDAFKGGNLRLERTGEWLNWRYHQKPNLSCPYRFFEFRSDTETLEAALVTVKDNRKRLSVVYVMDMACRTHDSMIQLLGQVSKALRNEGECISGAVVSSDDAISILKKSGFRVVPPWLPLKQFHTVAKFNPDFLVPSHYREISEWDFSLGDWDNL